jgi:hypothetical protein
MNTPWLRAASALLLAAICVTPELTAQSREIVAKTYYNTFYRAHPVLARIHPGDTVTTKTLDASGRDENGWCGRASQPADRPVLCRNAEPGDAPSCGSTGFA